MIIVHIDKGFVVSVSADRPEVVGEKVRVVDYDCDGLASEDMTKFDGRNAYLYMASITVAPAKKRALKTIAERDARFDKEMSI